MFPDVTTLKGTAPSDYEYGITLGFADEPPPFTHDPFTISFEVDGDWNCGDVTYVASLDDTEISTDSTLPVSYDPIWRKFTVFTVDINDIGSYNIKVNGYLENYP